MGEHKLNTELTELACLLEMYTSARNEAINFRGSVSEMVKKRSEEDAWLTNLLDKVRYITTARR